MAVKRVALDEFDPAVDAIEPSDQTRFNLFEYSVVLEDVPPTDPQLAPLFIALDEFDPANDGYVPSDLLRLNVFEYALRAGGICENLDTFIIDASVQTVNITLNDVLEEMLDALVEPRGALVQSGITKFDFADIASGLWSLDELASYLEQRRAEFLSETEAVYRRVGIATIPQQQRHQLPGDWVATRRVSFRVAANDRTRLHRADEWEMDHGLAAWQKDTGKPRFWMDAQIPRGLIQTAPASRASGQLEVLMVGKGQITISMAFLPPVAGATGTGGTGVGGNFALPNEFVPVIKWGALAMALGKLGRGHDPERAAYAEARYREGIEAAKVLLDGFGSRSS